MNEIPDSICHQEGWRPGVLSRFGASITNVCNQLVGVSAMKYLLISIFFLSLQGETSAWAEKKGNAGNFSVLVTVTDFAEERFMKRVRGFVMTGLMSFGDVDIVEDRELADYTLLILPTQAQTTEGSDVGFALFLLVTSPFREKDFDHFVERAKLDPKKNTALFPLRIVTTRLDQIQYLGYRAGPPEALKEICGEIVANFNMRCLEPRRKARAELKKSIEEVIREHQAKELEK